MNTFGDTIGSAQWGTLITVGNEGVQSSGKKYYKFAIWRNCKNCECSVIYIWISVMIIYISPSRQQRNIVAAMYYKLWDSLLFLKIPQK